TDQQRIILTAQGLRRLDELLAQFFHAAFSLDYFQQDGGNTRGETFPKVRRVIKPDEPYSGNQGLEWLAILFRPGGGKRTEGPAVKRILHRKDFIPLERLRGVLLSRVRTGELDGAVSRFSSAIGKEGPVEARKPGQFLRQRRLIRMVDEVRDMQQGFGFVAQNGKDLRVRIAQSVHRQAPQEVQVFLALVIPEVAALSTHRQDRQALVSRDQHALFEFSDLAKIHFQTHDSFSPFFNTCDCFYFPLKTRVPTCWFASNTRRSTWGSAAETISISPTSWRSVRAQERSFGIIPSRTTPR